MKTVSVQASAPYEVRIENGLLDCAGEAILSLGKGTRVMIVTDDTVNGLYAARLKDSLALAGLSHDTFVIPHGEASKCAANWLALLERLAVLGYTRTDMLCALGGGVVGDLTGFAAATYLRGIRYVGIPTTLLAMVDSSVGGKTAIDLAAGKNLCGAFHQPSLVLCDPSTLSTLPAEVFSDGIAEVIKYGFIGDAALLTMLNDPDHLPLDEIIYRCVSKKACIVEADEFEAGERKLLNFGHTAGHAIEALSGFSVPHGHGVAVGMVIAARFAAARGLCPPNVPAFVCRTVERYRLPTDTSYTKEAMTEIALRDKKRHGNSIDVVVPVCVGRCEILRLKTEDLPAFLGGENDLHL